MSPPPAPKKFFFVQPMKVSNLIIACDLCCKFMEHDQDLEDYLYGVRMGIQFVHGLQIASHYIGHLLEVAPLLPPGEEGLPMQFFAWMKAETKYREVSKACFEILQESKGAKCRITAAFQCSKGDHGFKIRRFECTAIQGLGTKKPELSPQQLGREKRRTMVRKFSQGRHEEIEEIRAKLESASDKEIDQISKKVRVERPEEVAETARRLSTPKEGSTDETDLHLARATVYYTESPLN
jgi:hypothetical protein